MADDSMLARFREMRKGRRNEGGEKGGKPEEQPGEKPGGKKPGMDIEVAVTAEPTFGDLKKAADTVDELAGPVPGEMPGGPGAAPAGAADDAAILAEAARVSPDEARRLLDAAKKLPEVADLDARALGERLREDFDLRMRLEEIAARPGRMEREGPVPTRAGMGDMGGMDGPPGGLPGEPGGM